MPLAGLIMSFLNSSNTSFLNSPVRLFLAFFLDSFFMQFHQVTLNGFLQSGMTEPSEEFEKEFRWMICHFTLLQILHPGQRREWNPIMHCGFLWCIALLFYPVPVILKNRLGRPARSGVASESWERRYSLSSNLFRAD